MEYLKKHWSSRPVSLCLSLLTAFTSMLLTMGLSRPVKAQQQVTRVPSWAVLDFDNQTTYGGTDIGREASDALVLELGRSGRYTLSTRSSVVQGLSTLGLTPPLDPIDVQKFGRQINVDAVVTGDVLAVTKRESPAQIDAVVAVRIIDTNTGELINGALAEGTSTPRNGPAPDEDSLVNEAISKAAFAAVKQITSYNLPLPTILNNEGPSTLLLNMGSRDGLQPGMKFLVERQGVEVGRITVGSVEDDQATANVDSTTIGIRPGDHARAIYSLPAYAVRDGRVVTDTGNLATGSAVKAEKKSAFSNIGGIILAILAAGLIVALVNRGSNNNNLGGGSVGGVTAQAAFGDASGLPYPASFNPINLTLLDNSLGQSASYGVYVRWTTGNINPRQITAFNIYRNNFQPLSAQQGAIGTISSTSTPIPDYLFNAGPVDSVGPNSRSVLDPGGFHGVAFPFVTYPGTGGTTTTTTTTGGGGGTAGTGGTTAGTTGGGSSLPVAIGVLGANLTFTGFTDAPPLALGSSTTYSVTAIYSVISNAGGTPRSGFEETSVNTSESGLVTPQVPIDVSSSSGDDTNQLTVDGKPLTASGDVSGVDLTHLTIAFQSNAGGDTYIVDASSDSNFSHKITLPPGQINVSGNGGQQITTSTFNLAKDFPGVSTIYFRIGSRFSRDNPGPFRNDAINPNPDIYSGGGTYLYSRLGTIIG